VNSIGQNLGVLMSVLLAACGGLWPVTPMPAQMDGHFQWSELAPLPDSLGVAGPFVGVHNDALIVAGGANFPKPVWDNEKVWHDKRYVMTRDGQRRLWRVAGSLSRPLAYGASVSLPDGVLCMGGNDAENVYDDVFLLSWNPARRELSTTRYPSLPRPSVYGAAALVGNTVYFMGGQSSQNLDSATGDLWALDLAQRHDPARFGWKALEPCPGAPRAFHLAAAQHNGYHDCLYVISGRRQRDGVTEFLRDVWEYAPATRQWRQRADAPRCVMAAAGIGFGQSHVLVLGGASEELFYQTDQLKDAHPGFIKQALAWHAITDTWTSLGPIPQNQVTTTAVRWNDDIIIPGGEIRPRVRSPQVWSLKPLPRPADFGIVNHGVLFGYLLAMVAVGFWIARRNRSTDDYFRGGKRIPWWAAGCSIFATMLSSLTYTGIPSKAYAQDWVYSLGNFVIPVVAVIAVFVALPFYRRIDATSAYEYLELRFSRPVRLFGSGSFALFHVFRIAVVMSLTALAIAVATPLTPSQAVLLMGLLCIVYCTVGGIEAVIWTDTIQTFVLLGGALLAAIWMVSGTDGGFDGFWSTACAADKFRLANWHMDASSARLALWVVLAGAMAQNLSSYTADQAVVQRYMTTATQRLAARSIWTNALLSIPATILFFGIGTALFTYYQSHPDRLDPDISTDQIFPLFIARELPVGIAGLIVAGIFAAAQSTVSTSMNSTSTTIVTDFLRPMNVCRSDEGYLAAARILTVLVGIAGTVLGLEFVDPGIRSLFDTFIKVIGLFMGVLGGLFILGAMTRRATTGGALAGALAGSSATFWIWRATSINGYLYPAAGVVTCVLVGYVVSLLTPPPQRDLTGLTIHSGAPDRK
jgi:SSS family transporter